MFEVGKQFYIAVLPLNGPRNERENSRGILDRLIKGWCEYFHTALYYYVILCLSKIIV